MQDIEAVHMTKIHEMTLREQGVTSYCLYRKSGGRELGGLTYGFVRNKTYFMDGVIPVYDIGYTDKIDETRLKKLSRKLKSDCLKIFFHTHPYRPKKNIYFYNDGLSKDDIERLGFGKIEIVVSSTAIVFPHGTPGTDRYGRRIITKIAACKVVKENGDRAEERLPIKIVPNGFIRRVA